VISAKLAETDSPALNAAGFCFSTHRAIQAEDSSAWEISANLAENEPPSFSHYGENSKLKN
jgi:hypothetical protein